MQVYSVFNITAPRFGGVPKPAQEELTPSEIFEMTAMDVQEDLQRCATDNDRRQYVQRELHF